jgi:V/A-type H+-transporting ATPase subunit F
MFDKVAIVGDDELVYAFRALGIEVFSPQTAREARDIMEKLRQENFAVCFLHESLFDALKQERDALRESFCPVIVGFSGYQQVMGHLEKAMKTIVIKSTGSDSLLKERNEHGRR